MKLTLPSALVAVAAAASVVSASSLTLYNDIQFGGAQYTRDFTLEDWKCTCQSLVAFNDRASSASWSSDFVGGIWFFDNDICNGKSVDWKFEENNYPQNFVIDGINDIVSGAFICRYPNGTDGRVVKASVAKSTPKLSGPKNGVHTPLPISPVTAI